MKNWKVKGTVKRKKEKKKCGRKSFSAFTFFLLLQKGCRILISPSFNFRIMSSPPSTFQFPDSELERKRKRDDANLETLRKEIGRLKAKNQELFDEKSSLLKKIDGLEDKVAAAKIHIDALHKLFFEE